MTEEDIIQALAAQGLYVDEGNAIGGPFIPDGQVRIYNQDHDVVAEGPSLEEAYSEVCE